MRSVNGFMLLEVLLSFFVLTLGIFTVSHLFLQALQFERQAYYLNVANLQAMSLAEQLQGQSCAMSDNFNLDLWSQRNQQYLPNGTGRLVNQGAHCYVSIAWLDPLGYECEAGYPESYTCVQLLLGIL